MRSWADLIRRTWEEDRLFTVMIELGYQCPLDCAFCYNDREAGGSRLTPERYRELFEDLRDLGVLFLSFSGGEPTAHPDFYALGGLARELGFVLRIKSCGYRLKGEAARRICEEIDPFIVELSLHGARSETHDCQTRRRGSFESLMETIEDFRVLGQRMELRSTLTRLNEAEIDEMFELAKTLEIPLYFNTEISPRDNGDTSPVEMMASEEGIRRLVAREIDRRLGRPEIAEPSRLSLDIPAPERSRKRYCGAGTSSLLIDPFGRVFPCVQWRQELGKLQERRIGEIWKDPEVLREIRSGNESARKNLDRFSGGEMAAFCPGMAVMECGRPDEMYEQASGRRRIAMRVCEREQNLKDHGSRDRDRRSADRCRTGMACHE